MAMAPKKAVLIVFGYDDGSSEYAVGKHATEVMDWLNACQAMQAIHGGQYHGEKMVEIPAPSSFLESIKSIAERKFPEWVEELRKSAKGQNV